MDILNNLIDINNNPYTNNEYMTYIVSFMSAGTYLYNFYKNYIEYLDSKTKKIIYIFLFIIFLSSLIYLIYYYYYLDELNINNNEENKEDENEDIIEEYDECDEYFNNKFNLNENNNTKNTNNTNSFGLLGNINANNPFLNMINKSLDSELSKDDIFSSITSKPNNNKELKFLENLSDDDRKFYIKKEMELDKYVNNDSSILPKYRILSLDLPLETKYQIIKKIEGMSSKLNPFAERDQKWVESFLKIPFNKYAPLPIQDTQNKNEIQDFFLDLKTNLDNNIYSQNKVKSKILELVAAWISNPLGSPPIIGLCGPPGIGKTSIIRCLATSLNRPFAFISMGGLKDGSELKGHSQTYVGSVWGKFTQILMEKQVMNPVIFMDEMDKISDINKSEINGVLMHIIDRSQNSQFQDSYFHGIYLDLSKCIFIFSFNDKTAINRILLDRMTIIDMNGYLMDDKIKIVQNYVLPNTIKNVGLAENSITMDEETIKYIVSNKCRSEVGMRDLIHKIEDIIGKINLMNLMKEDDNNIDEEKLENLNLPIKLNELNFPLVINNDLVDKLLI